MFLRVLEAERLKMKHSPIWLAFLLLPVIPAVLGTLNYWANREILQSQWYSLWTQHTLFSCYFFLPVLLGIYCAWLWRLEHQQHNWNLVLTAPVPVLYLYGAKLLIIGGLLLLTQLWIGLLFFLSGSLCGMAASFPLAAVLNWLACGWLGGMVICTVQLLLSLLVRSFAVPVGISLLGGMAALAATAKGWGVYFPYALMAIGMRANNADAALSCGFAPFLFFSISYMLLFVLLVLFYLGRAEVAAKE